jgi:hypothetical protein
MRQYEREDVDFNTFYSDWMKLLARTKSKSELERLLSGNRSAAKGAGYAHLRAIDATASMHGQCARRAHSRNVVTAAGDYGIALRGALEIHDLFPEHAAT